MNRLTKTLTAAAVTLTSVGVAMVGTASTAAAAPASTTTGHQAPAVRQTLQFGDTVTVDGFKIKITHEHAGRLGKHDDSPGRYTEDIDIRVTPTKHHKKWTPTDGWSDVVRYGAHDQHTPLLIGGQGFGMERPWVAGGRYAVGKSHYAKHLHYTFVFRGHKLHWAND